MYCDLVNKRKKRIEGLFTNLMMKQNQKLNPPAGNRVLRDRRQSGANYDNPNHLMAMMTHSEDLDSKLEYF